MAAVELPLPPESLRRLVCHDDTLFDLREGEWAVPEVSAGQYESVFDFGCGCGRIARQLMAQPQRPEKYIGIDINHSMVNWCTENLSRLDTSFSFAHHDVFNVNLGPENQRQRTDRFPVEDGSVSLLIAHSVFTHLSLDQTIFYLHEMRRVLRVGGVAVTTWFLFSRRTFPMMAWHQVCLFINEADPTNAVIYDWEWLVQAFRDAGLRISAVAVPGVSGHQWRIFIEPRMDDRPDTLPATSELLAGLCAVPADVDAASLLPHCEDGPAGSEAGQRLSTQTTSESVSVKPDVRPSQESAALEPETLRAATAQTTAEQVSNKRVLLHYSGPGDRDEFDLRCSEVKLWYHSYYFDNGFEIKGDYDIGRDVAEYGFPSSMKGMSVLDVGSGAGWFSHYFEQCGADVTAVDARGYEEFDVYGRSGYLEVRRPPDRTTLEGRPVHYSPVSKGLWVMKDILGSRVSFVNSKVYDLTPEVFGGRQFDLVFIGALLCHLRDPIGALMAVHRVCRGRVIASTPVVIGEPEDETPARQYLPYTETDRISWWLPNEACYRHWFQAAGFLDVETGTTVRLCCDVLRRDPKGHPYNGDQVLRIGSARV